MSNTPPQVNPAALRIRAANKLGVDPGQLTDKPGLPQASSAPRPQAVPRQAPAVPKPVPDQVPIPAPTLPNPVPMPQPRPPLGGPQGTVVPPSVENRLADAIAAKYGVERVPIPEPQQAKVTPSPGWAAAQGATPYTSPFSASANAAVIPGRITVAPPTVPAITPSGAPAPKAPDPVESRLAQAIANRYAPQPKPQAAPAPAPDTTDTAPAPAPKQGKYTPTETSFAGYYPRAADEEGKTKVKEPKALKKGPNFNYYDTLGVTRGDNVAAAHALNALRKKQVEEPQKITPMEDRLLASSGSTDAFNLSMEPAAVAQRFKDYAAPQAASGPRKWDATRPGGTAPNPTTGYTFQQGQRDPTVDQRDPAVDMATKTIDNAGKKAPSKAPVDDTPPTKDDEEGDD
jgi:hypothetical protein